MLLSRADLERMRSAPLQACTRCKKFTTKNYCRQCDEFFWDGHAGSCSDATQHDGHRTYREFSAVIESDTAEKVREWQKEAARLRTA
jgi:hypothetical protein